MCATVAASTAPAVTGTWTRVDPAGTAAVAGSGSAGVSLLSATVRPPAGAGAVSQTSTVTGSPLATVPGNADTDETAAAAAGVTVRFVVALAVPRPTVTVTGVDALTAVPVTVN